MLEIIAHMFKKAIETKITVGGTCGGYKIANESLISIQIINAFRI